MRKLLGRFGQQQNSGQMPPEMLESCEGRQKGDACTTSFKWLFHDETWDGTCAMIVWGAEDLACVPLDIDSPANLVPGTPVYRPCTLVFEGRTWEHVGIRFRGNASLSMPWEDGIKKLPFNLDFDRFEDEHPEIDNQRFFGFNRLAMINNFGDMSYLREKVATDIFREAGVPAPRTAFYRLFIDFGHGPVYFGLYTMIEVPDKPMFETQFGDTGGNLYKPEGKGARWVEFDEESFEKRTNEAEEDWIDVRSAITALYSNRHDPAAWRADLEKVFNVRGFLRWLAVNTVIQNWDTYGILPHNYYLYSDPDDGLLHWFPWDNGASFYTIGVFSDPLSLGLTEVDERWPLIRFIIDDPVYRATYISFAHDTIKGVFEMESAQARFSAEHDLIEPYVTGIEGEQTGYTFLFAPVLFNWDLNNLLNHVELRNDEVLQFLSDENFVSIKIVINEIHYNPSPAQGDNDYEFIEIFNAGDEAVDLSGYAFTDGIEFVFPQNTSISAGEYIIIAKSQETYSGHGFQVFQCTAGKLSNGGEPVQLTDSEGVVIDFIKYDDAAPWPAEADGDGPSLELIDSSQVNYLPQDWQASSIVGGTPGEVNSVIFVEQETDKF